MKTGGGAIGSTRRAVAGLACAPPGEGNLEIAVTTHRRSLSAEDVVDFERLVDLGEPFGPVGGAAAAPLVQRQFQLP
jgi:hypothetical protein